LHRETIDRCAAHFAKRLEQRAGLVPRQLRDEVLPVVVMTLTMVAVSAVVVEVSDPRPVGDARVSAVALHEADAVTIFGNAYTPLNLCGAVAAPGR
jgi:hypothetical protein